MNIFQTGLRLIALLPMLAYPAANASSVTWNASGSIWSVFNSVLSPYFTAGDLVEIRFTYETDSSPVYLVPKSERGLRLTSLSLAIGGQSFSGSPIQQNSFHPFAALKNNQPYDEFIVPYVQLDGLNIPGLQTPEMYFGLVDYTSTRFGDAIKPPTELGNLQCSFYCSFISYEDPVANASRRAVFDIQNITAATVPEPSTYFLFLLGMAAMAFSPTMRRTTRLGKKL